MKNCTHKNNWIYHCNIYQLKRRMPITFHNYFNCIETKQGWCSSFGKSRIYLYYILLLLTIYLYNKYIYLLYIYYRNKGKYIYAQSMAHLHGGATMWLKVCTTPLYSIRQITEYCSRLHHRESAANACEALWVALIPTFRKQTTYLDLSLHRQVKHCRTC